MKAANVVVEQSTKIKFIVLQVLTVLLVAATLVSFSDIKLPPFARKQPANDPNNSVVTSAQNEIADPALKLRLEQSEKGNLDKQTRISELEKELTALEAGKNNNASSNSQQVADLSATIQQLKLQYTRTLNDKENEIRGLEARLTTLQNQKNNNTTPSDNKAIVEKLRTDLQKSEARNALLVKLNNDLKKNNEYLSTLNKASRPPAN